MLSKLSFWQKIKLLVVVILIKYGIMKLKKYAIAIPIDDYKKEIFKQADWLTKNGVRYKVAIDPSGQERYLIDKIDGYCFRIKEEAMIREPEEFPERLSLVLEDLTNG